MKIFVIERIVIHTLNKNDMIDIIKAKQIRQSIKRKFNIITTWTKSILKSAAKLLQQRMLLDLIMEMLRI